MSTGRTWQIESTSLDDTLAIAGGIGQKLRGGEVIELISDLGGGKTSFVRGLVAGTGSEDAVRSPSFTIRNEYQANDFTVYHFDFYRLEEPGIIRQELAEVFEDPAAVVVCEWSDSVADELPQERISITITPVGEQSRRLDCVYAERYHYLFPENT